MHSELKTAVFTENRPGKYSLEWNTDSFLPFKSKFFLLLGILGGGVLLGCPNHDPILTAYIMGASRNLSYILQIPPSSASLERVWCFAVSSLKLPCFAILPAFRWRKLLSPHPPPLVPVDAATLNSRCISKLPQLSRSLPISLPWCGNRYAVRINYHFRPKKCYVPHPFSDWR